jgi:hypothetical protein
VLYKHTMFYRNCIYSIHRKVIYVLTEYKIPNFSKPLYAVRDVFLKIYETYLACFLMWFHKVIHVTPKQNDSVTVTHSAENTK